MLKSNENPLFRQAGVIVWIRLTVWCRRNLLHGDMSVKVVETGETHIYSLPRAPVHRH